MTSQQSSCASPARPRLMRKEEPFSQHARVSAWPGPAADRHAAHHTHAACVSAEPSMQHAPQRDEGAGRDATPQRAEALPSAPCPPCLAQLAHSGALDRMVLEDSPGSTRHRVAPHQTSLCRLILSPQASDSQPSQKQGGDSPVLARAGRRGRGLYCSVHQETGEPNGLACVTHKGGCRTPGRGLLKARRVLRLVLKCRLQLTSTFKGRRLLSHMSR